MHPDTTLDRSSSLIEFCRTVLNKHGSHWPPSEKILAEEFIEYFQLKAMTRLSELQNLCELLGIEICRVPLPDSLHGYNLRYNERRTILIPETYMLNLEHTVFHELREQMEYDFCSLESCTFAEDKEERADQFAIEVQLKTFGKDLPKWFDHVATIEKKWPRRAAYVFLTLLSFGYVMSVTILPVLEKKAYLQKA